PSGENAAVALAESGSFRPPVLQPPQSVPRPTATSIDRRPIRRTSPGYVSHPGRTGNFAHGFAAQRDRSCGTTQVAPARVTFPARSLTDASIMYSRPAPAPERSARTETAPPFTRMSPSAGSLLATCRLKDGGSIPDNRSAVWTSATSTSLWFGG